MKGIYLNILFALFMGCSNPEPNTDSQLIPPTNRKGESVEDKIRQQTFRTVTRFTKNGSSDDVKFGMGMILNGEYFATCYHLIVPEHEGYKFQNMYFIYNERTVNGQFLYDSIDLIKDYKVEPKQYDFSKHKYIVGDGSTDFIILKLSRKINPIEYKFSSKANFLDTVYNRGNVSKDGVKYETIQLSQLLFSYVSLPQMKATFLGYPIKYTVGFSGSPLFNTNGEILGMVQFAILPEKSDMLLDELLRKGQITKELADEIKKHLKEGEFLQFAINFNYLKEKYLKGYL